MENFEIYNPYNSKILGNLPLMTESEVEHKIKSGYNIFNNKINWLKPYERIEILDNFLVLLKVNKNEIIQKAILEGGKPYKDTEIEFERALKSVEVSKGEISKLLGSQVPMGITKTSVNRFAFTYKEPVGLVFAITAFNHPINLVIHQIVSAIAANCPLLIKPAKKTPFTCIKILEILKQTNIPNKMVQLVLTSRDLTEKIVKDKRISFLSFVGSESVGWKLRSILPPGSKCSLEHGGVAPIIVEKDADVSDLSKKIVKGAFYHAGQVCVSTQKVFINQKIFDKVLEKIVDLTSKLKFGNPLKNDVDIGPLISKKNIERIESLVKEAKHHKTKILYGGNKINDTCFMPTILLNPPDNINVSKIEIFGPILCIYSYDNLVSAIQKTNMLDYSFHAAIFSKNIDLILKCVKNINATAIMINDHTAFRVDWMPFAGRKRSGLLGGGILESINNFVCDKLVIINSKEL